MSVEVTMVSRSGGAVTTETMRFLTLDQAKRERAAVNPRMCHHVSRRDKPVHQGPRRDTPGYVYFILCEATLSLKIGFSAKLPTVRLRELQGANATELTMLGWMAGTQGDERELHRRFDDFRKRREWFYYGGSLRAFVENGVKSRELTAA